MEVLFEADYTRIELDSENKTIVLRLLGSIKHEDYKAMWNRLLEELVKHGIKQMIADQTQMKHSSMESKAWLVTKWFPKAHREIGNHARVALIASRNMFNKIGGEYIAKAVSSMSNFQIHFVGDMAEAKEWLNNH